MILSHINEDKRKTEGQKQIFDVVYEVDGCPVSKFMLLCSKMGLIKRTDPGLGAEPSFIPMKVAQFGQ